MRSLILFLLLTVPVWSQTPTGMMRWEVDDTTQTYRTGGAYQNYPDTNDVWHEIENDFHVNGSGLFVSWDRLLKTTVDSLGDVIVNYTHPYNDVDYTVIQEPHSLIFFRLSDSAWSNIDNTPNFNNVDFDSNVVSFDGMYPGVDYKVVLNKGRVENRYEFKPGFLDAMVDSLDQRPDSADIYLANVMKFSLSVGIDDDTVSLGNVRRRILKRWGGMAFQVGKTRLRGFSEIDTLEIPVWQRYKFVGEQLYVLEFVKASDLKFIHEQYPDSTLWHNTDLTIDGTTDIDDTFLKPGGSANTNYGTSTGNFIYGSGGTRHYYIVRANEQVNDSLGAGATITSAIWYGYVYIDPFPSTPTIDAYKMWKPDCWVESDTGSDEGGATWVDFESPDEDWGGAGCGSTNDAGSFNCTDRGGDDRKATAEDSYLVGGVEWADLTFTTAAQSFYDNSLDHSLLIGTEDGGEGVYLRPSEGGGNANYIDYVYTTAAGGDISHTRRRKEQQRILGD